MLPLWKDVYGTYLGDSERHALRLAAIFAASFMIAVWGANLTQGAFPTMSAALSILAGFTFTALFSSHYLTVSDLPLAKNENDRRDLGTLRKLSQNFRLRSKLFIALSVVNILAILFLTVELRPSIPDLFRFADTPDFLVPFIPYVHNFAKYSFIIGRTALTFIAFFLFLECLYTFYRLAETIMAALDIRRDYLDSHAAHDGL